MKDCADPQLEGTKWRNIAALAAKAKGSIKECNERWKIIREEMNK